jgi:hypothetical protein
MKNIVLNTLILTVLLGIAVRAEEKVYDLSRTVKELKIMHIDFKLAHSPKMGNQIKINGNEFVIKCLHVGIRGDNVTIKCKRGAKKKMANESVTVYADLSRLEKLKVISATGIVEGDIAIKDNNDFDIDLHNGANVTFIGKIIAPEVEIKVGDKSIIKFAIVDAKLNGKASGKSKILYQNVTGAIEIKVSKDSTHSKVAASGWW